MKMRNTKTQNKRMLATDNKSEMDLLSKELSVSLPSENKDKFSYNAGRKVVTPSDKKGLRNHDNESKKGQSKDSNGHDKNTETHDARVNGKQTENGHIGAGKQTNVKHESATVKVKGNKTRNSAFKHSATPPLNSPSEQGQKHVDEVVSSDETNELIDEILEETADTVTCKESNITVKSPSKGNKSKTNDSVVKDSSNVTDEKRMQNLKLPSSENDSQEQSKQASDKGPDNINGPSDDRKLSLSQRSVASFASSTESVSSLLDKILESRASMSNGSSGSLQDVTSRRFSTETPKIDAHEKLETKTEGSNALALIVEMRQEWKASARKHAPDTGAKEEENSKPIIKLRTRQRRILQS